MRTHTIQHVPFEGLGSIEPWLVEGGHALTRTRLYASETFPEAPDFDLLVVMGGPMSVNDEAAFPWLASEKAFIRRTIDAGKSVLGVCLGAQLIAASMGARVFPNAHREIGWFPVQGVSSRDPSVFQFPPSMEVFHWHGETFDLPDGAVRLAESEGCRNQAFQMGNSVIGLQFHLEMTPVSVREIVSRCGEECIADRYVQTREEIVAEKAQRYAKINAMMGRVLSHLQLLSTLFPGS